MFDVCTTGDTAHINTIFKLSHTENIMKLPVYVKTPISSLVNTY